MKKIIQVQFKDGDELRVSVDNSLLEEGEKDHCTGCTDPRSEGTHQMETIEHSDTPAPAEWEEKFRERWEGANIRGMNKEEKKKAWAIMVTDNRIAVSVVSFGVYMIFPSRDQAEAYLFSQKSALPNFAYIKEIEYV